MHADKKARRLTAGPETLLVFVRNHVGKKMILFVISACILNLHIPSLPTLANEMQKVFMSGQHSTYNKDLNLIN